MMKVFLLFIFQLVIPVSRGHGTMTSPIPRQPESLYWYQVGCMIGCTCSGGGKETYPTKESVGCNNPDTATLGNKYFTWNVKGESKRGDWNKYMPWRRPGSSKPLDSCGIASGFLPSAAVQYAYQFKSKDIKQGMKGTELPKGEIAYWKPGSTVRVKFRLAVNHGGGYQYRVCSTKDNKIINEACFEKNPLKFASTRHIIEMNGEEIPIAAVDVSEGVLPAGSTWRKLPLPACNCDLGASCKLPNATTDKANYTDTIAYASSKPYGVSLIHAVLTYYLQKFAITNSPANFSNA